MKLSPVYLVAPEPDPPSMPTRRAFLIAGGTFAAGLGLGGACGFAAGASGASASSQPGGGGGGAPTREPELEWERSDDALLEELRRLAVKAPIEELVEKRHDFLDQLIMVYPTDQIAWRGVGRIAQHTLTDDKSQDRRLFARWLVQVIEAADIRVRPPLLPYVERLRKVK